MDYRRLVFGALTAAAVVTGGFAVTSPAWAEAPLEGHGCHLSSDAPKKQGSTLSGTGHREQCADQVTYLWVRVYRAITLYPDSERAVVGRQYVQNDDLTAKGSCDGPGQHYTHTSTATGVGGDSVESGRVPLC